MPSTFSLRFLSISAVVLALIIVFSAISILDAYPIGDNKLYYIGRFLFSTGLIVLGLFMEFLARKKEHAAKIIALVIIVLQAITILIETVDAGIYLSERFTEMDLDFLIQLVHYFGNLFFPVGMLFLAINYLNSQRITGYNNRIFLILHAVYSLIARFFFLLLTVYSAVIHSYYGSTNSWIDNLFYVTATVFDIAMLYYIFSQTKSVVPEPERTDKTDLLDAETVLDLKMQETQPNVGLINWFGKHIWLCIPLVNFIFLIYWSGRSQSRVFRNWAIAHYWLTSLGFIVSTLLIYRYIPHDSIFSLALLVLPIIIIVGGIVMTSFNDQRQDGEENTTGIGTWMGRIFIAGLPLAGLIYLIVLSTDDSDRTQQNWAKARLLMMAVNIIIVVHYFNFTDRISNLLSYTQFAF